jgi:hypothetical protein
MHMGEYRQKTEDTVFDTFTGILPAGPVIFL